MDICNAAIVLDEGELLDKGDLLFLAQILHYSKSLSTYGFTLRDYLSAVLENGYSLSDLSGIKKLKNPIATLGSASSPLSKETLISKGIEL